MVQYITCIAACRSRNNMQQYSTILQVGHLSLGVTDTTNPGSASHGVSLKAAQPPPPHREDIESQVCALVPAILSVSS